MVAPAVVKKKEANNWSTNSYLLLAVKILLAVIIILLLPKLVTGRKNASTAARRHKAKLLTRQFADARLDCQHGDNNNECSKLLVPEESWMCVSQCISAACHDRIYASNPLEDGEVDAQRFRDFESCFRDERRLERKMARSA